MIRYPIIGIEEQKTLFEVKEYMEIHGVKEISIFRTNSYCVIGKISWMTVSKAILYGLEKAPVKIYMQPNNTLSTNMLPKEIEKITSAEHLDISIMQSQEYTDIIQSDRDTTSITVEDNYKVFNNLSRLMKAKCSLSTYYLLEKIGKLGDLLEINVYAVGGIVRELLLSNVPQIIINDIDIVVEGDGIKFAQFLAKEFQAVVRKHPAFMTASLTYDDTFGVEFHIDVATARLEYYPYPSALPQVTSASIREDLFRRDITMNALAIQLNKECFGRIFDLFNGVQDIQNKSIQIIHSLSFIEDPTRIIRAIRFEQRYQFCISIQTEEVMKNALSYFMIEKVFGSRLRREFELICKEKEPQLCIIRMNELGVLAAIDTHLVLTKKRKIVICTLQTILEWYASLQLQEKLPSVLTIYLLGLCYNLSQEQTKSILQKFGVSTHLQEILLYLRLNVKQVLEKLMLLYSGSKGTPQPTISAIYVVLYSLSLEGLLYLKAYAPKNMDYIISSYIQIWRFITPDISGSDLKQLGFIPGPQYKYILQDVLKEKLDGKIQTKQKQINYILSKYKSDLK